MNDLQKAKENLKALMEGKRTKRLTLQEARENLIKCDPQIDIAPVLSSLNKGDYYLALKFLFLELVTTPGMIEFFAPIIVKIIEKRS